MSFQPFIHSPGSFDLINFALSPPAPLLLFRLRIPCRPQTSFSFSIAFNFRSPISRQFSSSAESCPLCSGVLPAPAVCDPSLDLAHRAQYLVPRVFSRRRRQTISRRKLRFTLIRSARKPTLSISSDTFARNCFHMDMAVKPMDAASRYKV